MILLRSYEELYTQLSQQALTYLMKGRKIEISKLKTETISALTDGVTVYLNKKDGFIPEFEEGVSYGLQKYTLLNTFGQMYLFVGSGKLTFKTVPQDVTEETSAKHALCPRNGHFYKGRADQRSESISFSLIWKTNHVN